VTPSASSRIRRRARSVAVLVVSLAVMLRERGTLAPERVAQVLAGVFEAVDEMAGGQALFGLARSRISRSASVKARRRWGKTACVPAGMATAIAAALNVGPSPRPATAAAFAAMLQ
jgi:hypothetical protein